jgi:WD40 repeat protein
MFSPDGSKLASASLDKKVVVWDPNTSSSVEMVDVGGRVSELAFSLDGSHLKTDLGSVKLKSVVGKSHDESAYSFHLQVGDDWILRYGCRTIWLPPELRGGPGKATVAVSGSFVAFGHSSGAVSFWEIGA